MLLFSVAAWPTLQFIWTIVLHVSQFLQIARQMTTLEVSNIGRYGFMGSRGASLATQMGRRHMPAAVPHSGDSDDSLSSESSTPLAGFDHFTSGKTANGLTRAGHATNPFNVGVVGNCRDFWSRGQELGVEYDRLYEIPVEVFREARRRRERDDAEEPGVGRKGHGLRQKLMLGLGIGGAGARAARGGYEPVSQV